VVRLARRQASQTHHRAPKRGQQVPPPPSLGGAMRAGGFLRGALRHAPHRARRGSGDLTRSATRSATHSAESGPTTNANRQRI